MRRVSLILRRHATTSSRQRRFAVKVYKLEQSSHADGNHRKDQSITAPKERQQAVSEVKTGVNVSGSIVLRSWRADNADVAHTVTETDRTVSDFPSETDFAAIPSHQPKSASVKGSNAIDSSNHDPTDVQLDYEGVDIAESHLPRMPLDRGTIDVNPTAVMVDKTEIQKEENSKSSLLRDQIGLRRSSPAAFGHESRHESKRGQMIVRQQSC